MELTHTLLLDTPPASRSRKIFLWRSALLSARPILPNMLLIRALILLKLLQLRRIHVLNHIIRLPLFKTKP